MNKSFISSSRMAVVAAAILCTGLASCSDKDHEESTLNPAQ